MVLPASAAAQSTCSQFGTVSIKSGQYIYQNNEWNSGNEQCATVSGTGFTLTTANFEQSTSGAPATYPSIFRGCHWGDCTTSNPFPIEVSNIASASTSVSITQPSGYNNDAAYDIWFNQTSTTSGQPNGTEIMIWTNHQGSPQPFGSQTATVTIDGTTWAVWTGQQSSWNVVSYVRQTPVTSVSNLNLLPFFSDAVSRGSLQPSWWLIDVEYGFEIWTGGQGLAVSGFSVSAAAGSGGGGSSCASIPSAPSGVKGTAGFFQRDQRKLDGGYSSGKLHHQLVQGFPQHDEWVYPILEQPDRQRGHQHELLRHRPGCWNNLLLRGGSGGFARNLGAIGASERGDFHCRQRRLLMPYHVHHQQPMAERL